MKRNQWSAGLLAFILFGSGAAVGALGHRYYAASTVMIASVPQEDLRRHYISEMTSRLNLSSRQINQVEDILDETKSRFREAHETCRPAVAKVKEQQIADIKAILTAPQIPLYDQLLAEREHRAKEQEAREHQAEERAKIARRAAGR